MQPHSNSTTSLAAAQQIEPNAGTLEADVLLRIRSAGSVGMTDQEIQNALGMNPNTQRPRRRTLTQKNLIADSGRTRPTSSGRSAIVWVDQKFSPSGGIVSRAKFIDRVRTALGADENVTQDALIKRIEALAEKARGQKDEFTFVAPENIEASSVYDSAQGIYVDGPSPEPKPITPEGSRRRGRLPLPDRVEGQRPSWFSKGR